jgi:hypothetical protein
LESEDKSRVGHPSGVRPCDVAALRLQVQRENLETKSN